MGRKINCYPFCRPLLKATVHYNVGRVFCESSFRFFATQLDVLIIPRLIAWCVPPSPPERWPKKNVQHQWFNDLNHQQKKILWQFVALMKHKPTVLPIPIYPHHFSLSGPSVFFEAEKKQQHFSTRHTLRLQDWGVTVENPEETFKSMDADGSGKHLFFER